MFEFLKTRKIIRRSKITVLMMAQNRNAGVKIVSGIAAASIAQVLN
jgi:hypothetical protein